MYCSSNTGSVLLFSRLCFLVPFLTSWIWKDSSHETGAVLLFLQPVPVGSVFLQIPALTQMLVPAGTVFLEQVMFVDLHDTDGHDGACICRFTKTFGKLSIILKKSQIITEVPNEVQHKHCMFFVTRGACTFRLPYASHFLHLYH
jgi:hypothetical protein